MSVISNAECNAECNEYKKCCIRFISNDDFLNALTFNNMKFIEQTQQLYRLNQ